MPIGNLCIRTPAPGPGTIEYLLLKDFNTELVYRESEYVQARSIVGNWQRIHIAHKTGRWTEDAQRTDQGIVYRVRLQASLYDDSYETRGAIDRLIRQPVLLRITNGSRVFVIGTQDLPMRLLSDFDSGSDAGDARAEGLVFAGSALRKTPGYTPVF